MSFLRRQLDAPKKLDKTIFGLNWINEEISFLDFDINTIWTDGSGNDAKVDFSRWDRNLPPTKIVSCFWLPRVSPPHFCLFDHCVCVCVSTLVHASVCPIIGQKAAHNTPLTEALLWLSLRTDCFIFIHVNSWQSVLLLSLLCLCPIPLLNLHLTFTQCLVSEIFPLSSLSFLSPPPFISAFPAYIHLPQPHWAWLTAYLNLPNSSHERTEDSSPGFDNLPFSHIYFLLFFKNVPTISQYFPLKIVCSSITILYYTMQYNTILYYTILQEESSFSSLHGIGVFWLVGFLLFSVLTIAILLVLVLSIVCRFSYCCYYFNTVGFSIIYCLQILSLLLLLQ